MSDPRIRRIEIRDFRAVRGELILELVAPDGTSVPHFVLAGPNGSGKTSVLEAVLLALGRDDLLVRDLPKDERDGHWRTTVPAGASLRVTVQFDDSPPEVFERDATTKPRRVEQVAYFSSWRAPYLVGPVEPLGRGRRPDDTESNRLWRLKQRIIDERAKRGFDAPAQPALPGLSEEWLDLVNRAWRQLHGDDGTQIVAGLVDPLAEGAYADLFIARDGKRICSIDQASSGEIELLSFAGWMAITGFSSGLLVIDEPELHLHPEWQGRILPALRVLAPRAQFLIATHVDAPWDAACSWERALLVPESDPRSRARRQAAANNGA